MLSSHYHIATEGIRGGHKAIAKLGFGHFVQIIVTDPSSGGGGGSLPNVPDNRTIQNPIYSLIRVEFYGKEENFVFYQIHRDVKVQIEVNLFRYTIDRDNNAIIDVTLVSSTKKIYEPPKIIVKEITDDSTKRIEQPRICVEYPKLLKQTG